MVDGRIGPQMSQKNADTYLSAMISVISGIYPFAKMLPVHHSNLYLPLQKTTMASRKEEIATAFLQLADTHIADLLGKKADRLYHAKHFAALLFIHPRHLTTTVKEVLGRSVCDIMEERIVHEAQLLLQNTNASVADIAYTFCYNEPTNFIKFFKGMCGQTPLQYRKRLKAAA
jgi:AraC family transcriptional regulator, regulatory protein of adaptative response / methylphosphotriester-DNA alkyltransferase methyltransferase